MRNCDGILYFKIFCNNIRGFSYNICTKHLNSTLNLSISRDSTDDAFEDELFKVTKKKKKYIDEKLILNTFILYTETHY